MSTNVTLHNGHDVAYFTSGQGRGGCAGSMSYYTAAGEPPGEWAGKGAAALGLAGQVDPSVIGRLYQHGIGPAGELLARRRRSEAADEREAAAVAAYLAAHPYASATELAEVRVAERGKDPHTVPYFDLTVSAVKSVSVLHASYRVSARQARERGDEDQAAALDAKADEIEQALMEAAREAAGWLERHATYTRTGHHSARTGEWRDGGGLVASLFLHHLSRDGDPQLHVHAAIWNRTQRADGADDKWRTLDSRTLHNLRLAVAPVADRILETRLSALGYVMVPRADGNGAEVGGVGQDVMDLFSSRAVAVTGELERLAPKYQAVHGRPPSRRTLWLLHQQAGQNTRRTKAEARRTVAGQTGTAEPTAAQRLAVWEAQTVHREMQALSGVHEQVARFAARERAGRAPAVLNDASKRAAARIAVAEVQKHHAVWSMAQLRFEVHRALPVLKPGADGQAVVTEVARLAVSGRVGAEVIQVTAPDPADVTSLGVRASDGGSIYRPPYEERYCTLAHLDTEEQILTAAKRAVPQLVSAEQTRAAVERTGLNAEQRDAVAMMLTATTATTALIAPAGAGKSHAMAEFARLWTTLTGRRVIGLTTSTNAARVLAHEGLAESYNIAQFLGKIEGSNELRRPILLHENDVLVLDEASQISTADLAMIGEAARQAGARVIATGDTAQLGAVEAGGMFGLLAWEVPAAELHEVRRFDAGWEREASVRLRDGDLAALAAYDRHGRIRGADAAFDRAASMWLADHLRGKDVLLLAGSNAEAADLARRVQAKLTQMGKVGPPQAALSDGNRAGVGNLVRARLNTEIDADGRALTNRDTLKVTAFRGPDAEVRRQRPDGTWTAPFRVPRSYLAQNAELAYAGNVHVAQGRTVDTAHLLVSESLTRQALYVGMTRGRQANTAYVVTGSTAPPGREPYQQAAPESVLAGVLQRGDGDLSATEQIRQAQDWAGGTGHLLTLWSAAVKRALYPDIDEQITARLTETEAWRYQREPSRKALQQQLRAAQLAGHDISAVIGQITAASMDGARSIASVLHGRLQHLALPQAAGHDLTWTQRTRASAPAVARELAAALDDRARALGEQLAVDPAPWLARQLGVLASGASPALREEYARRAGAAAAYREAAGITDPDQAVSPSPHLADPELETMRRNTIRALEIRDETDIIRGMTPGELKAQVLDAEHAQASAPPDVSSHLRLTAQAEADAWQQSADATATHDHRAAANARALARQLAAEKTRLEAMNASYEAWSGRTSTARETAAQAKAELRRRGHAQPAEKPPTTAGWWRQFEADLNAMDRAIQREHQAAIAAGQPWPPQHTAETETTHVEAAAVIARLVPRRIPPGTRPGPGGLRPDTRGAGHRTTRTAARARRPVGPTGHPAGPHGRGRAPHRGRQRRPGGPRTVHRPPRTRSPRPSRTSGRTPGRSLGRD